MAGCPAGAGIDDIQEQEKVDVVMHSRQDAYPSAMVMGNALPHHGPWHLASSAALENSRGLCYIEPPSDASSSIPQRTRRSASIEPKSQFAGGEEAATSKFGEEGQSRRLVGAVPDAPS